MKNTEYFKSSAEVFDWLSSFINLERGQKPKSFRLERMEALTELTGHPQRCAPSIHIAGSKGKGSVTTMLAAILTEAGLRTARYMSPHVIDIRERICMDGSFFDEEIYCSSGGELRHLTETLLPEAINIQPSITSLFNPEAPDGAEPTFWELLTLLFFMCARRAKCGVMVAETGMGGRLDSTNVLDPLVSVITLIELEHTSFLGNTIEAVASEKAGIIKKGKPLILAKQCDEALQVFKKTTQEKNSSLFCIPEIAELTNINVTSQGTSFTLSIPHSSFQMGNSAFYIPIPGKVQAENAALAIAAIKTAFPQISADVIRNGLANLKIPARFENISRDSQPPFVIDGAHTPESLRLCVETFCSLYGEGNILIFGCAADKDASEMARIASPHFSKIIITTPGNFKVSSPEEVYSAFSKTAGEEKTELIKDTKEAVKQALNYSHKKNLPVLGTGSFYLVSEIRKIVISNDD
ncbi:MAG: bifunctional folylpolyglutamate synthase/dihydrofolate synthase [Treponema sp.]|nr:bifunctional folylpolyglutamate synthase/dihydrofolate synthase [Treponema sp.]